MADDNQKQEEKQAAEQHQENKNNFKYAVSRHIGRKLTSNEEADIDKHVDATREGGSYDERIAYAQRLKDKDVAR